MERRPLWAPWRIAYVTGEKRPDCIFCAAAGNDQSAGHVILRGGSCLIMLNAFPYAPGHLLVAPYRHVAELDDLQEAEQGELLALVRKGIAALRKLMDPDGFNVGLNLGAVAGAGIADHLHMHVVPRWEGDTNFMPVLADTRVIPQALEATRDALVAVVRQVPE